MKMKINTHHLLYTTHENVRISDINYGNHLGHTQLVDLLHNVRALYLKNHQLSELNCFGTGMMVLNLQVDWCGECFFNDKLEMTLYLHAIERATVEFAYRVKNLTQDKIAALGTTRIGFIDIVKQKPVKPPAEFMKILQQAVL